MLENPNSSRGNTPPKTPAWVKVFFILFALLILVVIAVHLMGVRFDHGGASGWLSVMVGIAAV